MFYEENMSSATFSWVVFFAAVSGLIHKVYQKMDQMLETKTSSYVCNCFLQSESGNVEEPEGDRGPNEGNIAIFCRCA